MPAARPLGPTHAGRLASALLLLMILFLAAGAPLQAAERLTGPRGTVRPYTAADFFAHPRRQRSYTETWAYELHLDSGRRLLVSFLKTNLGVLEGVCGVQVWFMGPDTAPVAIGRELPLERYREDREGQRISWKHSAIAGLPPARHTLHLDVPKGPGILADIDFHDLVPGFVDGDGTYRFGRRGRDELIVMVPIPRARTSGTIHLGDRTYDAAGWAYAEHTVQTALAKELLQRRWSARFIDGAQTVSVSVLQASKEYGGRKRGLAFVADPRGVLEVLRDGDLSAAAPRRRDGQRIGTEFQLSMQGQRVTGGAAWQETALLQRFVATSEMSGAMAWLVRRVAGDPVFYRFANRYAIQLTVDGTTTRLQGAGFHEVMVAR